MTVSGQSDLDGVLLIGFDGGGLEWLTPNPSQLVVDALDGSTLAGVRVVGRVFPPDSSKTAAFVTDAVRELAPSLVIGFGVFPGIPGIQVERLAVNIMDFQRPTLDGATWRGAPVRSDGPAAYFATVPVKAMVAAIREAGVPARVSNSASTHGCNQTLYLELDAIERQSLQARAGFIHLPNLPEHVARSKTWEPTMSLDTMLVAIRVGIETAVRRQSDIDANLEPWEW